MAEKNQNTNCDMRESLVSYLYGESTTQETARVESHLAECVACKHEFEGFQRVRGMLQHWQLDEMPLVRFEASTKRTVAQVLGELLTVMPFWTKALSGVAAAVLVMAVLGTEVTIGSGGVHLRTDILRKDGSSTVQLNPDEAQLQKIRAELISQVDGRIAESQRQHREELRAQLVSLEAGLSDLHSADLAKLEARIKQQRAQLKSLERDLDRREGLDVTDILFSEAGSERGVRSTGGD